MLHHKTYHHETSTEWVTFIHGAGGTSGVWFKQLREYRKQYNVLMIDLRGHGNSKFSFNVKNFKNYTFDLVSKDVIDVLDQLEINQTHFVGISLGCIIIRNIAELRPDLVRSMVMGGAILKLNFRSRLLIWLGNAFKSVLPYMILYKLFAFVVLPRKNHKESRMLFIQEAKNLYQKEFIRWFRLTSHINPLLNIFRSKDSSIPTLYLMGEQDYMFLAPVEYIVDKHASAELIVVPDCGHVVNVENPSFFNENSLKWLNALPKRA